VKLLVKLIVFAFTCMVVLLFAFALLSTVLAILVPNLLRGINHAMGDIVRGPMHLIGDSSMDVATLSVLLVFGIPIIAIVGGIFLSALKILKGEGKRKSASNDAEEARMIQDIYHGLVKMEQRVESLETLLLDRQRKGNES
jgi:phage shock protein B